MGSSARRVGLGAKVFWEGRGGFASGSYALFELPF